MNVCCTNYGHYIVDLIDLKILIILIDRKKRYLITKPHDKAEVKIPYRMVSDCNMAVIRIIECPDLILIPNFVHIPIIT